MAHTSQLWCMVILQARKMFEERNPSGRFGRADEVALLAVYLASDEVGT